MTDDEQLHYVARPPEFHKPALPFRDCACGGRVRVAGVEMATRSRREPRVHFQCSSCGTTWLERPAKEQP